MKKCLNCNNSVKKFKTNSHVIPRYMFKLTKEKGKNTIISIEKNEVRENNQKDYKGDFICDDCETFFEKIDTASSLVLLNKKKLETTTNKKIFKLRGKENTITIWKFVISVIIRHHIYQEVYNNKNILGDKHFKLLKEILKSENPEVEKYPLFADVENDLNKKSFSCLFPYRGKVKILKSYNFLSFSGAGFLFTLFINSHHFKFNNLENGNIIDGELCFHGVENIVSSGQKNILKDLTKVIHSNLKSK